MMSLPMAWEMLYGEKKDPIPNINQPENSARVNAERKEERERYKRLKMGVGGVLVKDLEKHLKDINIGLFTIAPDKLCGCTACRAVSEMHVIFKILSKIELAVKGDSNER